MRAAIVILTGILLAGSVQAQDKPKEIYSNSYMGKTPPPVKASADNWLNVKQPYTPKDLEGKVVWLEFSFLH